MVPGLQQAVAAAVAVSPIDEFALAALTRKQVAGRSLWEGEPDLPTTPSPGLFTFVRNVSVAMTDAGMDLWGPAALAVLKQHLRQQVSQVWLEALAAGDAGKKSPEASAEAGEGGVEGDLEEAQAADDTQSRDLLLQWLYDVSYLRRCLASPSKTTGEGAAEDGDELKDLQDKIQERAGLDAAARQRLAKSAQERIQEECGDPVNTRQCGPAICSLVTTATGSGTTKFEALQVGAVTACAASRRWPASETPPAARRS
ncbi:hypothetical protein VTK73DRAFT_6266 [Phialemonium thermophilum]|uniref:Uncharacterized protein n=1 Tax=Phialemonium thermophilum TaxID=223376 RepID=A0ABR3V0W8_9PEZI